MDTSGRGLWPVTGGAAAATVAGDNVKLAGLEVQAAAAGHSLKVASCAFPKLVIAEIEAGCESILFANIGRVLGGDGQSIIIPIVGTITVNSPGKRPKQCQVGELLVVPTASIIEVKAGMPASLNILKISHGLLELRAHRRGVKISGHVKSISSSTLRYVQDYLRVAIHAEQQFTHAIANLITTHVADLLSVLFVEESGRADVCGLGIIQSIRFTEILKYIEEHMEEPELGIDAVAKTHHISPHYVRKLFYESGMTFTDYLTGLRLDAVYQRLACPENQCENISTLAYAAGFNNLAWFNRAFKRRFNMTPSVARKKILESGPAPESRSAQQ